MTAEAWPTEDAATAAVDAAARLVYERQFPPGSPFLAFDELPANEKVTVKNAVLEIVWAAIAALPDPRYAAWEEGLTTDRLDTPNPYPSGL